ncbi:hypothetical protein Y032_0109g119 [Ancylostoma ceylanicum]|uniref:Uncharacterized protein n=1 Tax=Ancylostoma ceylanicum TaxID=53326 RepID=A0A016TER8_9BILA|nr:hypothetical protein Y032_0109g119 [Ancylostoma ceylanicum]
MEAEDYFSTYDALHAFKGNSPVRRLELRLRNVSSISKVVWSSFDFMCGPELKFVWEISPSSSVSPVNLSGEEGSVNDAESLDSSMTTSTVQFEDIDDPLQIALTSTTGLYDSMFMDDSMYHEYHLSSRGGYTFQELRYLDEFMMNSNYSGTDSSATMTDSRMQNPLHGHSNTRSTSSATTLTAENSCEELEKKEEEDDSAGLVDPMAGTPMELMNISTLLSSEEPGTRQSQDTDTGTLPARHTSGSSTTGGKTSTSSFAKLSDEDGNNQDKSIEEREGVDSEKVANALTTSCVDSGIGGTISTHSDLSALCLSPLAESSPKEQRKTFDTVEGKARTRLSHESANGSFDDEVVSVLDLPLDAPSDPPSDELFVSKFVLAEQVFSVQLPSNPLMHKMKVVPSRNLLVGSFIFSVPGSSGSRTIHAISLLMNIRKQEWYMERQQFFESVVLDIVPRLKASMVAEDWEDVVIRANVEFTRLMHLVTVLDRYPLVSESRPLLIKNSLLTGKRCYNDKVLCKAISGVLQSQGQCVIIGSDNHYVSRLLHTLAAFIPEQLRWCCPRMYRHKFSPYLRLQVVRRYELTYLMQCGALATWPLCVVDVDRATVCMSAPYSRHRILKQRADAQRIEIVLEGSIRSKPVMLELSSCRILDCVKTFLRRVDLLPVEESARMGLVNQLLLYVENMARALIVYVQHASEPLPTEKSSATKSSRFSLSECRKALDLQSDGWFHAVLARAELISPDIAEFIYSSG